MLSPGEREEIRQEVYRDVADIEDDLLHRAGSYTHLCVVDGDLVFAHGPVGRVVRRIGH